jgi:DNA-binding NarL/FixJ family response regulator
VKTLRILIADDHDIVREGLRALLESQPNWLICGEAATGREAVTKTKELWPDVVVLDFSMPDLNGLEATRQIRKAFPGTEVLILTMHDSEQLAREVLAAGAHGFLVKTDVRNHIVAAIQALAQHKPFFSSAASALLLDSFLHPENQSEMNGVVRDRLTPREREVLQLIAEAKGSKEIAATLGISVKTVEAHRSNIMVKLNLHSVSELVLYALRNRIAQP